MKKKTIEKIPYLGLQKISRKKICKVHWGYCNQDYRT